MGVIDREEINEFTKTTAEAMKTAILNAMPAAGVDQTALDAAVDEILAQLAAGGGIKKVQRGLAVMSSDKVSVTISSVNMNKSFLILPAYAIHSSGEYVAKEEERVTGNIVSSTKIELYVYTGQGGKIPWQVVEFN